MKTIWKLPLETTDTQDVSMPAEAEILCVQVQRDIPCIWILCDPELPTELRTIEIFGTGHPVQEGVRDYIGTYQLHGGGLIFHTFERK